MTETCETCGLSKESHGAFSDHKYSCPLTQEQVSIGGGLSAQSVGAKRVVETISPCSCFDSIHKALLRETGVDEAGNSEGAKKGWDKRGRGKNEQDPELLGPARGGWIKTSQRPEGDVTTYEPHAGQRQGDKFVYPDGSSMPMEQLAHWLDKGYVPDPQMGIAVNEWRKQKSNTLPRESSI